jgi:hypothetical protein
MSTLVERHENANESEDVHENVNACEKEGGNRNEDVDVGVVAADEKEREDW